MPATTTHPRPTPLSERCVDLADYFGTDAGRFSMVMTGDGFDPVGIYEGDRLVIRRQREPADGDLVVIHVDKQPRVRRWHSRDGGRIELSAPNPAVPPIVAARESVYVVGVVIGLMRKF